MNCDDAQLRLADLLSQGRSLHQDPELQEHLSGCVACQAWAADLQEVMLGLLHTPSADAPPALKEQLFAQLHGGPSCEQAQTLIAEQVCQGILQPDQQVLQQHLERCPDCQAYSRDMQEVAAVLPFTAEKAHPPAALKTRLLEKAGGKTRTGKPLFPWWGTGLAATVAGVLWVGSLLSPAATASLAPEPSVVVHAGNLVVFANSNHLDPSIVLLDSQGRGHRLKLPVEHPPYFTEGVAEGDRVYLLDTSNQLLIVVHLPTRSIERTHNVHAGASGLSVRNGRAIIKCALSGFLTSIGQDGFTTEVKLAVSRTIPEEAFMDSVLQQGNQLWVTHHQQGKVFLLNADTLQVQNTLDVEGEPVALAPWGSGLLVLDHTGRLLQMEGQKVTRELALEGHPDKITVASDHAYLSDRSGWVRKVDLGQWKVVHQVRFGQPMDITTGTGGQVLLADRTEGVQILDINLQVMEQVQ